MTNFLYPPRPEQAIGPGLIKFYEKKGWIGQLKKNGTCSLAFVDGNSVTFKTRHNENHKAWTPTNEAILFFTGFPNSIFVFELLHSKGGGVRDTIYIFDVLKYLGSDMIGRTLIQRMELLNNITPISKNISIAKIYDRDLTGLYKSLISPLDEGIVLKDPLATLRDCNRDGLNASWQVKCRIPTKNFGF